MSLTYHIEKSRALHGKLRVASDKSISHRSIMLGAIADGTTHISDFLTGQDALATLNAFRTMGVNIEGPFSDNTVIVHGVGKYGLKAPAQTLDCGNSGTSMRLLTGLLCGQNFTAELLGDSSLNKRPMRRVSTPLQQMGAKIELTHENYPPLKIYPTQELRGIHYEMPVASAQVKSAILLAGLYAKGKTTVIEFHPTRDHTEKMLQAFQYPITISGNEISITGEHVLKSTHIKVPADISSAAFFIVAASITPDSDLLLTEVGVNSTRTGIIDILKLMGADITLENQRTLGAEPIADIRVRYSPLHGIPIPEKLVPLAIDEFPVIFIAAANAKGETVLTGAQELRVKESDRIQVMADGLKILGVNAQPSPEGIKIKGGSYHGGIIKSHGDHRIAMAFTIAALTAKTPIQIHDCDNVATSFPNFVELAKNCGINIQVGKH